MITKETLDLDILGKKRSLMSFTYSYFLAENAEKPHMF